MIRSQCSTAAAAALAAMVLVTVGCSAAKTPVPTGPPVVTAIGDPIVNVPPADFTAVPFTVADAKAGTTIVTGRFATNGGNGTITVFITDGAGVAALKAKQEAKAFYSSGSAAEGDVDAEDLPAGNYFLVFDNRATQAGKAAVENHVVSRFQAMTQ